MTRSTFHRDDRGAIMLIAVFLAIFAVALLYYLIGISSSVLFREKFQDAADSAVLSAAIMRARGMNLIVLINIIMAALLAVLVTIKLIETLAIIGIGFAAAFAWCTFGATLVAIPPLQSVQSSTQSAYEGLRGPIFEALTALHGAADAVKVATPIAADGLIIADIEAKSEPPGTHGVAFDTRPQDGLPVEDDDFSSLCGRAGEVPAQLASAALSPLPGVSELMDALAKPMGDLSSEFSTWFCGDGSSAPPPYIQHVDVSYPRTELSKQCESDNSSNQADPDGPYLQADPKSATSPICENSQSDEQAAKPDKTTGGCEAGHDCSLDGPYEKHVALAREQCDPTVSPAPFVYYYQARSASVEYKWTGKTWVRGEPVYQAPYATSNGNPPCGPKELCPVIAEGYNTTVRKHADVNEVLPVCSNEEPPSVFSPRGTSETTKTVTFIQITHILGCQRHETKSIPVANGQTAGGSGNDKSPKRVQEKDNDSNDVKLGDENFQVRAIMMGSLPASIAESVMHLALWNQKTPDNPLSALRDLGNFSVAQAEYFYDANDPRSEWLWNMNWRARLRRFRLPTGKASSALSSVCDGIGSGCGSLLKQVQQLKDIIAH